MSLLKVIFTTAFLFSAPLIAQAQSDSKSDPVVVDGNGVFALKQSELINFLKKNYGDSVRHVSLRRGFRSYIPDNPFTFYTENYWRVVSFTLQSDTGIFNIECDLRINPYWDLMYTTRCAAQPNAVVDDSYASNSLSRFTKITKIKSK